MPTYKTAAAERDDRIGKAYALLAHWFPLEREFTATDAAQAARLYPPLYDALEGAGCKMPRSPLSVACFLRRYLYPRWGWQLRARRKRTGRYEKRYWRVVFVANMPESETHRADVR